MKMISVLVLAIALERANGDRDRRRDDRTERRRALVELGELAGGVAGQIRKGLLPEEAVDDPLRRADGEWGRGRGLASGPGGRGRNQTGSGKQSRSDEQGGESFHTPIVDHTGAAGQAHGQKGRGGGFLT